MRALLKGILSAQAAEPPPASCLVAMSGDPAPGFGLLPAQVEGRRVYVESVARPLSSVNTYAAISDLENPKPMLPGERIAELYRPVERPDNTSMSLVFIGDAVPAVILSFGAAGDVIITAEAPLGTVLPGSVLSLNPEAYPSTIALGVDGDTGTVEMYLDGVPVGLSGQRPVYDGIYEGAPFLHIAQVFSIGPKNNPEDPDTVSTESILSVAAGTMVSFYPTGRLDWCGNALPGIPACQIGRTLEVVEGSATVVDSQITVPASGSATRLTQSAPIYLSELTAPRMFEFTISTTGDAVAVGVLLRENTSSAYPRIVKPYNQSAVNFYSNPGPSAMGGVGQTYGICVTPEGTFSYFVDGVYGGELPGVASLDEFLFSVTVSNNFTGQPVLIDLRYTGFEYSAEYRAQIPTAGDWCGNALPEPPAPELLFTLVEDFSTFEFFAENDGTSYDWADGSAPQMPTPATIATAPLSPSAAELTTYVDAVEASITDGMADGAVMGWIGIEFGDDFLGTYNDHMIFGTGNAEAMEGLHESLADALAALSPGGFLAIWVRSMTVTESPFEGWNVGDICPGMAVSGPTEIVVGFGMPEVLYTVSEA